MSNMYGYCDRCDSGPTATIRNDDGNVWFLCTAHADEHMAAYSNDARAVS